MPSYKFEEIVKTIAKEKGIEILSSLDRALWQIKKDLESKAITADQVPDKMKAYKEFRLGFSRDDFETIVKAIK